MDDVCATLGTGVVVVVGGGGGNSVYVHIVVGIFTGTVQVDSNKYPRITILAVKLLVDVPVQRVRFGQLVPVDRLGP